MDYSSAVVKEETTERRPSMVICQVSLGTGSIDISSDDTMKWCRIGGGFTLLLPRTRVSVQRSVEFELRARILR